MSSWGNHYGCYHCYCVLCDTTYVWKSLHQASKEQSIRPSHHPLSQPKKSPNPLINPPSTKLNPQLPPLPNHATPHQTIPLRPLPPNPLHPLTPPLLLPIRPPHPHRIRRIPPREQLPVHLVQAVVHSPSVGLGDRVPQDHLGRARAGFLGVEGDFEGDAGAEEGEEDGGCWVHGGEQGEGARGGGVVEGGKGEGEGAVGGYAEGLGEG